MNELLTTYAFCAIAVFLYVTLAFGVSRALGRRNDLADVAWGGGFIVVAWTSFLVNIHLHPSASLALLVASLVSVWGVRLSLHILQRFLRTTEDRRYTELRAAWGKWVEVRSYLSVFVLQGLLMLVITLPVVLVNISPDPGLPPLVWLGLVLWLLGFSFESLGDAQLARFLADSKNKGKLMTAGLWRYTRHPNYFGELAQWWGIGSMALCVPWGWPGLFGPLVLSLLIITVTGIPLTEKRYAGRKDWEVYKRRTSMLLPWPPRR